MKTSLHAKFEAVLTMLNFSQKSLPPFLHRTLQLSVHLLSNTVMAFNIQSILGGLEMTQWKGSAQGLYSGESARLLPMWTGSIPGPGVICGMSLLLVHFLPPRFFAGYFGFNPSTKPTLLNFNSIGNSG